MLNAQPQNWTNNLLDAPAKAGRFFAASESPAPEVRESELKKIKKKWENLKLGLDTGGGML